MTLDDELRRRLQQAADRAGEGTDSGALAGAVAAKAAAGAGAGTGAGLGGFKLFGALGATGLVVGGALGFTLLRPAEGEANGPGLTPAAVSAGALFDCPDGAAVDAVHAGDRLFAVGRTDDSGWLAVRSPSGGPVNWLPATALDADDDRDLPVLSCTETIAMNTGTAATTTTTTVPTSTTSTTVPPTSTTVAPTTTVPVTVPPTAPTTTLAPDTQKPTVQASTNLTEIFDAAYPTCDNEAVLTAIATDNVGVTSVTGTWSGLAGSPKAFTKGSGNSWTMQFGPFSGLGFAYNQLITITITAKDAAGNSQATTVQVRVYGECLL